MDGLGKQFLTHPGLSAQKHRRRRIGGHLGGFQGTDELRCRSDNIGKGVLGPLGKDLVVFRHEKGGNGAFEDIVVFHKADGADHLLVAVVKGKHAVDGIAHVGFLGTVRQCVVDDGPEGRG